MSITETINSHVLESLICIINLYCIMNLIGVKCYILYYNLPLIGDEKIFSLLVLIHRLIIKLNFIIDFYGILLQIP